MCEQYEYDVAFSFLAEDEVLAHELNELVRERVRTFLYSERQAELAGTDGENTFNDVFARRARTVVVLYRAAWGTTPWTRVEETAIRNRAFSDGYDFALLIPLDQPPTVPAWLPRTRIWFDLLRFGSAGAAALIEMRVEQAGGTVRPETAVERAARAQRNLEIAAQREAFRNSIQGVADATTARVELFLQVRELADQVSRSSSAFRFMVDEDRYSLILRCGPRSLSIDWSNQFANTLSHSTLLVRFWRGAPTRGPVLRVREPETVRTENFDFTLDDSGVAVWQSRGENRRYYTGAQLAEHCITRLIELVERADR